MRISDWSSDFCSSDLLPSRSAGVGTRLAPTTSGGSSTAEPSAPCATAGDGQGKIKENTSMRPAPMRGPGPSDIVEICLVPVDGPPSRLACPGEACTRSEEHTSELQSLMRISYAVFCLKKKTTNYETKATYRA